MRNLMIAWNKANLLDPIEITKMNNDEIREYCSDVFQKIWDENNEANIDEVEEL